MKVFSLQRNPLENSSQCGKALDSRVELHRIIQEFLDSVLLIYVFLGVFGYLMINA